MNLKILTGAEALACVGSEKFRQKWMTLHALCPWSTPCQYPDFVEAWYSLYQFAFLPVIIFEEDEGDAISGLLTLALHASNGKLTGAGAQQAEYQAWIQLPDRGNIFILNAIREVRARFPASDLHLKYMPPDIPLDWHGEHGSYGDICTIRKHSRPIMRAEALAMERQRNKKNHRQNYNRLSRVGEIRLERVIDHEHFIGIFDEICTHYDFRQAAYYGAMPFLDDPLKKPFYLALHKRGLLHVTILMVGKQQAAAHIGLLNAGQAVHLSITSYNPLFAAHSPGGLLLAMLGVQLSAEKMPVLDLSPGGDRYKEHFATEHDLVVELIIYRDRPGRFKTEALLRAKKFSKKILKMTGYRSADVLAAFEKIKRLRRYSIGELLASLGSRARTRSFDLRHEHDMGDSILGGLPISINGLNDVLRFDSRNSSFRFFDFLSSVMKRWEMSHSLYSFVQNDKLCISCWVRIEAVKSGMKAQQQESLGLADSIILFDLQVHSRLDNLNLVQSFVRQILLELKERRRSANVYYRGILNVELKAVFERCGFVDQASGNS